MQRYDNRYKACFSPNSSDSDSTSTDKIHHNRQIIIQEVHEYYAINQNILHNTAMDINNGM